MFSSIFQLEFSGEYLKDNPGIDYAVMTWWKSDKPLSSPKNGVGDIWVGKHENDTAKTANGKITIETPSDGGNQLYLLVKIGYGFEYEGSTVDWLRVIYQKQ